MGSHNPAEKNGSEPTYAIEDTKVWQLLAWVLSIVGAIIVLIVGPKNDPNVKHWVRESIAFFLVAIVLEIVGFVIALIPFIGGLIYSLIALILVVIWVLGIVKILQGELWEPPIVHSVAEKIQL